MAPVQTRLSTTLRGFKHLLDQEGMVASSTFPKYEHTYFGKHSSSRVDYISLPRGWQHRVVRSHTLRGAARKLQLIPDACLRDHVPILVEVDYRCPVEPPPPEKVVWHHDDIGLCLKFGYRRAAFVSWLEDMMRAADIPGLATQGTPDSAWETYVQVPREAAREFFTAPVSLEEGEKELRVERDFLLKLRFAARRTTTEATKEATRAKLADISKRLRTLHQTHKVRLHALWEDELEEARARQDHALEHRLSRKLSGVRSGSKLGRGAHDPTY